MKLSYIEMAKVADGVARYFEKIPVKNLNLNHHAIGEDDREKIEKGETPALPCGCVGSWWAIKVNKGKRLTHNRTRWKPGASKLAKTFGFHSIGAFTLWLGHHPALWGNQLGGELFSCSAAYSLFREDSVIRPKEVAEQFKIFASNLRKEAKKNSGE